METFETLKLSDPLARGVQDLGYSKPSPIQAQTLPILLGQPTDFIGLAATGTGKTAAFGIPLLEKLDPMSLQVQVLVLCPTRELCIQVSGQISMLGKHLGVEALPIYGGAGYAEQLRGLRHGAQVVVGTPGRLIDHLERGSLNLDAVKIVVLDEADEMISMGFREDMETILRKTTSADRNIWLFSATMSPSVRKVADQFLKRPQQVQVNRAAMLSATVQQSYFLTQEKNKAALLCNLIDAAEDFYGLVFCQTKALVMDLNRYLAGRGYEVDCLHGDLSQRERDSAMARFRDKQVKILICTDVAARGLDVKDVSHVINYSIPRELDSYVHRIGRTARSGKAGLAISLVTPSHRHLLGKIEHMTKSRLVEGVIPTRKAIGSKKLAKVLQQVLEQRNHGAAIEIMDPAWQKVVAEMGSKELAGRFISLMFPELFAESSFPALERSERHGESRSHDRKRHHEGSERQSRERHRHHRRDRHSNNLNNKRDQFGNYPPRKKNYSSQRQRDRLAADAPRN